jgi:hypothetical protein
MHTLLRSTQKRCRELVAPLTALLQDPETEVRSAALKGVDCYVELIGADGFAAQVSL